MAQSLEERFWAKVSFHGSVPEQCPELGQCWEWVAARSPTGYGLFSVDSGRCYAHRVAWSMANGEIPTSVFIRHRCDNHACVRPSHLFAEYAANRAPRTARRGIGETADTVCCANGHKFTPETTLVSPTEYRYCLECQKIPDTRPKRVVDADVVWQVIETGADTITAIMAAANASERRVRELLSAWIVEGVVEKKKKADVPWHQFSYSVVQGAPMPRRAA